MIDEVQGGIEIRDNYNKPPLVPLTGKEVAYNVYALTSNEDEEPYERIINIQRYCRGVLNPPVIPAEPIEVEDEKT